jgi:DNA-binding transcriptional MocR family regulator
VDRDLGIPDVVELLGDWHLRRGPLYHRLADALERTIRDGGLHPGDPLPPERPFAKALAVSRATVVSAYDRLRERGMVDSRQGSGTRVSRLAAPLRQPPDGRVLGGRATSLLQRMIDDPAELISLTRAVDAAAPEVGTSLREIVDVDLSAVLREAPYRPAGPPALRAAVAEQYHSQGLPTGPEQILITSGPAALNLICTMYVRRGTSVMVERRAGPAA